MLCVSGPWHDAIEKFLHDSEPGCIFLEFGDWIREIVRSHVCLSPLHFNEPRRRDPRATIVAEIQRWQKLNLPRNFRTQTTINYMICNLHCGINGVFDWGSFDRSGTSGFTYFWIYILFKCKNTLDNDRRNNLPQNEAITVCHVILFRHTRSKNFRKLIWNQVNA